MMSVVLDTSSQQCITAFADIVVTLDTKEEILEITYGPCPSYDASVYILRLSSPKKGKFVFLLNQLSTTPWRRIGEWMYR
jgi:hypothetical protein